jgi:hypothetical protein
MTADSNQATQELSGASDAWGSFRSFLAWTLIFGLSYTQAPLYYSNQNQYFLHGLADAGRGYLHEDWLANTDDPTPLFSAAVAGVARWLHEYLFYLAYLLLLGTYFQSLMAMSDHLGPAKRSHLAHLVLATALVVIHAALTRWLSARLFGVDYPWYFQAGVAGQYLLGFGLQPSACGVFLLVSILAFVRDRPWQAATWACLAAVLHATYLLSAALLVVAYLGLLTRAGRVRQALLVGMWALLLVAPVVAYSVVTFAPTSPETFAEAQRILAHVRIPHHAEPERWFDSIAAAQVAWIITAILLVRNPKLRAVLLISFTGSLLLTMLQIVTGSDTLALLFPWRTSALLVPVATMVVFARLVDFAAARMGTPSPGQISAGQFACATALAACIVGGILISYAGLGFRTSPDELPLLEFVKANKKRGETYLLPVEVPKIGAGPRGAASTNFTPAPRRGKNGHLIAIDLQRFRLFTGAAIYVDFKSIPYQDGEVLEWHRRLLWARRVYEHSEWDADIIAEVRREGITHVVAPADRPQRGPGLTMIYEDAAYRLYRVAPKS